MKSTAPGEVYEFCVVCPDAQDVYLMGDFNGWSTTATPMVRTEENIWQLSLWLPGDAAPGAPGAPWPPASPRKAARVDGQTADGRRFSYFVIDKRWMTGSAAFGNAYLLPGTWASVLRTPAEN